MPASSDQLALENWPPDLTAAFKDLPQSRRWWIALSGGCDSTFLLHCLATLAPSHGVPLHAIHLHHGLSAEADQWQQHCERICTLRGVSLVSEQLALDPDQPDLEARARRARYDCFESLLAPGDLLFMAHHGDDQAETVLLRLLRGSGVRGLAGMPAERPLGKGRLVRPLLGLERRRIEALGRDWALDWCEDGSNQDTRFDRNYLRHEIMPRLESRWPRSGRRMGRSAQHCREAEQLLSELADMDARSTASGQGLSVQALAQLSSPRRHQLLRHLLIRHDCQLPGERRLASGLEALLHAPEDGQPELRGEGWRVCRFRDQLWLVPDLPVVSTDADTEWLVNGNLEWFGTQLAVERREGNGLVIESGERLRVQARQGGERFRPGPGQPHRPLRKWLQEQRIPPWERAHLPLVFSGGELVAIADLWLAPEWRAGEGQTGWQPVWHRPWQLLQAAP
ncbi:MAG: tRNA lysidine(34) synthetase TilS [Halospina sp.]